MLKNFGLGGGVENFTTGGGFPGFGVFLLGVSVPHYMPSAVYISNFYVLYFHLALDTNKQKKKGTVRQKKSKLWKGESDGESDDAASGKENKKPLPGKGKRKQNVRTRKTVLLNQVFSSDDEDIFE